MHLLTVIIAVLLWLPIFGNTDWEPTIKSGSVLYYNLCANIGLSPWILQIIAFVLMIVEAFMLMLIDLKFIIMEKKTIMLPLFFVLIVSTLATKHDLLPVILANGFFILSMNKVLDNERHPNQSVFYFESGLFVGIATIIFPTALAMMVVVFATQFILRYFDIREFLAAILGFVVPFLFYLAIMFLLNSASEFFDRISAIFETDDLNWGLTMVQYVSIGYSVFFVLISMLTMQQSIRIYKVSTRKYFVLFIWLIITSVAAFFLLPCANITILVFASIALSFIASMFFNEIHRKVIGEILLWLLIISAFLIIYFA